MIVGSIKRKRQIDMSDLSSLQELIQDKLESLEFNHTSLQSTLQKQINDPSQSNQDLCQDFKQKYISLAGDLVLLSRSIVATWTPLSKQCFNKEVGKLAITGLMKLDVMAGKLRAAKNSKNSKEEDYDSEGLVMETAIIVVGEVKECAVMLEGVKGLIVEGASLNVELQV